MLHPKVADVAVFGHPRRGHGRGGEGRRAAGRRRRGRPDAGGRSCTAYAQEHVAGYKVPRTIDFMDELPRLPTGKLYKRVLRDAYWQDHATRVL